MLPIELCCECSEPTGKAGRSDDSIYIDYDFKEIGPLCEECRTLHWVCEECGMGVLPVDVTHEGRHVGCGGECT